MNAKLLFVALLGLTILRLAVAFIMPLAPDEAYYFTWARQLQAGYFDHPPMVALWIKLGTDLCGNNALGVRLLGPISAFIGSWFLFDAGNRLLPGKSFGVWAVAFFNATLMLGAGCVLMTPDTPLVFFWTLGLWALARLVGSGNPRWWLAVGGCAGLMLFSKYTGALFMAGAGLWALTCKPIRGQLRTIWPWAGAALAFLLFAPDIFWNATHGWISYIKQGSRVEGFDLARSIGFLAELLGGQFMLLTPIIACLAVGGLWRLRGDKAPGAQLLLWLTLLPAAVFLEHVLTNRVESNWPAILYPTACLAAAAFATQWRWPALWLGLGITGLVYLQALTGILPLPAKNDTTALQMAGWQGVAKQAAAMHPAFLTSYSYSVVAELAFYAPQTVPVVGFFFPRWSYFNWPVVHLAGQEGLLLARHTSGGCKNQVGTITRWRGHQQVEVFDVCRVNNVETGWVVPRP